MAQSEYRVSRQFPKKMWISIYDTTYYEIAERYDLKLKGNNPSFNCMTFKILFCYISI